MPPASPASPPPAEPTEPIESAEPSQPHPAGEIGLAEFAREFRRRAVTVERVTAALGSLASRELRVGPYSATGFAAVSATGRLGVPRVRLSDPAGPSFAVTVPAVLDLRVRVGAESRLRADVEIDLVLTPRPADPLLLVIDAAPVRARDVRMELQGRGLGAAVSGILGGVPAVITDEVRRQVARQVSGLLAGHRLRRARTIDIAARTDGVRGPRPEGEWRLIDDEEFGRRFVRHAVSEQRVQQGFAGAVGDTVEIGPMKVGPGGLAEVRVTGTVGEPVVVRAEGGAAAAFDVSLPIALDLVVDLARDHHFHAEVTVPLRVGARPVDGLRVVIDIAPVADSDVVVALRPGDRLAGMLGRAGRIEEQIAHQVATTVNRRVGRSGELVVDIGARIDGAVGDTRPRPAPRP